MEEHSRRQTDNMGPMDKQVQKNPMAALSISALVSVVAAMLSIITFITTPIKDDLTQLSHRIDTNQANVHDITKRIGSKPRAAADVAKLYGITEALQRDINRIDHRINDLTDKCLGSRPFNYNLQKQ